MPKKSFGGSFAEAFSRALPAGIQAGTAGAQLKETRRRTDIMEAELLLEAQKVKIQQEVMRQNAELAGTVPQVEKVKADRVKGAQELQFLMQFASQTPQLRKQNKKTLQERYAERFGQPISDNMLSYMTTTPTEELVPQMKANIQKALADPSFGSQQLSATMSDPLASFQVMKDQPQPVSEEVSERATQLARRNRLVAERDWYKKKLAAAPLADARNRGQAMSRINNIESNISSIDRQLGEIDFVTLRNVKTQRVARGYQDPLTKRTFIEGGGPAGPDWVEIPTSLQATGVSGLGLRPDVISVEQKNIHNLQERTVRIQEIRDAIEGNETLLTFWGKWKAGMSNFVEKLSGKELVGEEKELVEAWTNLQIAVNRNINQTVKEITGATMTVAETVRITGTLPNFNMGITAFKKAIDTTERLSQAALARAEMRLAHGLPQKPSEGEIGTAMAPGLDRMADRVGKFGARHKALVEGGMPYEEAKLKAGKEFGLVP